MSDRERYYRFYNANDAHRWGRQEMPEQHAVTRQWLLQTFPANPHAVVLELGCGVGALSAIHPNYIGLDFSFVALQKFATGARHINGDMQALPFKDNSVDFMFSWAALEHVPYPEDVLTEVERVLKAGGVALLAPAWNVRTWAAKGLPVRSYRELSWGDRLRKMAIPLLNSLPWRAFFAVPRRLYRELRAWRHRPLAFDYTRLSPNLQEYIYTDCDAFASMDAHAAIVYFKTRDWSILSHKTFLSRLLVRHEAVVVRKPIHSKMARPCSVAPEPKAVAREYPR